MKKHILFLAAIIPLLTMGTGCTKQVADRQPTTAGITSPLNTDFPVSFLRPGLLSAQDKKDFQEKFVKPLVECQNKNNPTNPMVAMVITVPQNVGEQFEYETVAKNGGGAGGYYGTRGVELPAYHCAANLEEEGEVCIDQPEGTPVITSLSSYAGPVGTKLEIKGCNFAGFEGDKNAWIENSLGVKGFLVGGPSSTAKLLQVTLKSPLCQKDTSYSGEPCDAPLTLTSGTYKIYTMPWGKKSNEAVFMVK